MSFVFIGSVTVIMNLLIFLLTDPILHILNVPDDIYGLMREYVVIIFGGLFFTFLYNYFAFLLRATGNSAVPLYFLGIAAVMNIILDILFVVTFKLGIGGAALATVIAQGFSGIGLGAYVWFREPSLRPKKDELHITRKSIFGVMRHSSAACVQQSVMNLGILMIQGLVNSFGTAVMAAFAAAVKIDSFAYMPAQEFGNAFSLFISQNHGCGKTARVKEGVKKAVIVSGTFCLLVSAVIFVLAPLMMQIFISADETEIIRIGTVYLRTEGSFYIGIGVLFLLYGFYRGIEKPEMSLVLTVISLGTRVLLAYMTAPLPQVGVMGIWLAIPIGWILADITGIVYLKRAFSKSKLR